MPRCEEHFQFIIIPPDAVTCLQEMQWPLVILERHIPAQARLRCMAQYHFLFFVQVKVQVIAFMNELITEYMIKMTMCV